MGTIKAYLAWPVKLKGSLEAPGLHITLKYLGDSPFTLGDLGRRLAGKETAFPMPTRWVPEKFNRMTHVLALEGLSAALVATHAAVADLRPDDYPTWRPHLTLDKSVWSFIARGCLTPAQCIESIGPLTLYVDKKAVVTF